MNSTSAILPIVMRYVHIVSAVLAVGGLAFLSLCLSPAMRMLDESFRESVAKLVQHRFYRILWVSLGGLVVSGVYNWIASSQTYKAMGPAGNALIGTKVLLALVMFAIVWAGSIGKMKPKAWHTAAVHLAAIVMLLAVILRHFRLEYLQSLASGG